MKQRLQRINSLIQTTLSDFCIKELSLKSGVLITIMKVDTSKDLRYARIFISVFPNSEREYGFRTILHEQSKIQKALHQRLFTKILPKISFTLDETELRADIVERLFQEIKKEK